RQLQQPDRLLQLRRQRQVLRKAELKRRLHRLHAEVFAQIYSANTVIIDNLFGMARSEHGALVDDVGAVADAERFSDVMVRYEDADAAFFQEPNDPLDVEHRDRVDAGERLVEQDEGRAGAERARDLQPAALAPRQ